MPSPVHMTFLVNPSAEKAILRLPFTLEFRMYLVGKRPYQQKHDRDLLLML